jgi:hypothetical protein
MFLKLFNDSFCYWDLSNPEYSICLFSWLPVIESQCRLGRKRCVGGRRMFYFNICHQNDFQQKAFLGKYLEKLFEDGTRSTEGL